MLEDPGGRVPAPRPLEAVQRFVNTIDLEDGVDKLSDARALRHTLESLGVLDGRARITRQDLERARATREAVRGLLLANAGEKLASEVLPILDDAGRRAQLALRFDAEGRASLEPRAGGVDGALGQILAIVFGSMKDGTWPRLKACRRDPCHWVFFDHSRNRSGRWCAMSVCGNRAKTSAYRRRSVNRARRRGT
jgi:predicted RNA-binding Zn ribbon-like protein